MHDEGCVGLAREKQEHAARGVGRWCAVVGVAEGEGERDADRFHLDGSWVSRVAKADGGMEG